MNNILSDDVSEGLGKLTQKESEHNVSASGSNELLCEPWPLKDILYKLVEAADILLLNHDYDGDGWEQIGVARDKAVEILKST